MAVFVPNALVIGSSTKTKFCTLGVSYATELHVEISAVKKQTRPFPIEVNAQYDITMVLFDRDPTSDFSGANDVLFEVFEFIDSPNPALISKSLSNEDITLSGEATLQFLLSRVDLNLVPKRYYWEASVEASNGLRYKLGSGPFNVVNTRIYD